MVNSNTAVIAHGFRSRQVLDDAGQMELYINGRLIDGLKLREDAEILTGDGTGANLTGLMTTSGIGNLDAAYWTANPLATAGAAANSMDRVRRAVTYVQTTDSPCRLSWCESGRCREVRHLQGHLLQLWWAIRRPQRHPLWGLTVVQSTSMPALLPGGRWPHGGHLRRWTPRCLRPISTPTSSFATSSS